MFTTKAPAKINLDLRIVGTLDDGYHGLDTVFQSVALSDVLTLEPSAGPFSLVCTTPGVPITADNLAWKGASAVAAAAGTSLAGWRLHLEKRVPAAAGLGGGSADAAAAARLVLAALGRSWDEQWLAELLAPIGADVAFFAYGGTRRGRGRGDQLDPLPEPPLHAVLLVDPGFGVSTREAYRWFDEWPTPTAAVTTVDAPAGPEAWPAHWRACRNDLQPAVAARHPAVGAIVQQLRARGAALAMMSGSGSAVFGLFVDETQAAAAAGGWPSGYRTWVTRTLDRAGYRALTAVHRTAEGHFPLSESRPVV